MMPTTTLLVNVDDDDQPSYDAAMKYFPNIAVSRKAREDTLGEKYNRALGIAPADIYVTMVDYAPILTKGFDHRIAEAAAIYPDRLVMVHGHWANLSFPSMQAVTRQLVEAMGGSIIAQSPALRRRGTRVILRFPAAPEREAAR